MLKSRAGRMSYMKLIKLLYLADREALGRWGRSITGDGDLLSEAEDELLDEVFANSAT